jgi:hypothetical protein
VGNWAMLIKSNSRRRPCAWSPTDWGGGVWWSDVQRPNDANVSTSRNLLNEDHGGWCLQDYCSLSPFSRRSYSSTGQVVCIASANTQLSRGLFRHATLNQITMGSYSHDYNSGSATWTVLRSLFHVSHWLPSISGSALGLADLSVRVKASSWVNRNSRFVSEAWPTTWAFDTGIITESRYPCQLAPDRPSGRSLSRHGLCQAPWPCNEQVVPKDLGIILRPHARVNNFFLEFT